jgi:Ca2+-binding RTX toxin-like protein
VGNGTFSPAKLTTTVYGLETTISGNIGGGITNGLVTIGGGIIPANSDGTFGSPIYMPGNTGGLAVVADVTGDGQPDVVTIGRNSNGGCVIQTEIDQTAVTPTPPPGLFPKTRPAPAVPTTGPTQPSIVLENNVLIVTGTPQTDTASVVSSEGNLTVTINSTQQAFAADQVTMIEFFTRGGNDSISIGAGSPPVLANGGGGNDTIIDTSSSPDTLSGGAGGDSLQAGSGVDLLQGGSGNDTLVAADGADTLFGNGGDDSLIGGSGASLMEGGAGDDTLVGGTGNNTLLGGDGNDSLVGGGTNLLDGNRGADTLAAGPNDTVISNSKDVVLQLS